ncbi:MAG: rhomboid family intramembrane serine protease [Sphingobacteriaceae bacterium]
MNLILSTIKQAFADQKNPINKYIAINAFVFVALLISAAFYFLGDIPNPFKMWVMQYFSLTANWKVFIIKPWTFFTYAFIHEKLFHLIFNMLVFHWFGNLIIEYLNKNRMLFIFWAGVLGGGILYALFFDGNQLIGASAGIMALVIASATLLPNYEIVLAIFGRIKLKYVGMAYLVIDLLSMMGSNAGGSMAHLGGAFIGFLTIKQIQAGNDWSSIVISINSFIDKIFTRKNKLKIVYQSEQQAQASRAVSQAEVDQVLEKITKSGYDSLSKSEKELLFKASKK